MHLSWLPMPHRGNEALISLAPCWALGGATDLHFLSRGLQGRVSGQG